MPHRHEPAYIPLSKALAQAHARLYPEDPYKEAKTLSVIAMALSALIPIYRRDPGTGELVMLTEPELVTERFTKPATEAFAVSKRRFEAALEAIQIGSLDEARASLTLRQSPRALNQRRY